MLLRSEYLFAVALLAFNDGLLKPWSPSMVTGKLSDFAGLFFAPVLLLVLLEMIPKFSNESSFGIRRALAYGAIGFVFSLAQVTDFGAFLYKLAFSPARLIPTWRPGFALTQDPTDLVALIALFGSFVWSNSVLARSSAQHKSAEHAWPVPIATPD